MPKKLTVVLGAGFSANAGMPIGATIAGYFDRDLKEKLLCFSSSEWAWTDDKDKATLNNGKLNFDWLPYSYVFNELVKVYKAERGSFLNYEDFYQFIIDNLNNEESINEIFNNAKHELLIDREYLKEENVGYNEEYLKPFENKQLFKIAEILNYLIADLLYWEVSDEEIKEIYSPFIEYIQSFDEVDVFTLNHDLLLERIFSLFNLDYTKGFSTVNSPIHSNNKALSCFNGNFDKSIRVFKLHGSVDLYRFNHCDTDGLIWRPNGNYDYYLTNDYSEKHHPIRINPETGKVIQDYNFDIVPKFITGTKKTIVIENDIMYKQLFEYFEKSILSAENIFISGYSFSDKHIDVILEKNSGLNFINHNRSTEYPYQGNGINIKNLTELKK